jgi:uncharacterized protein (DUF1697 family)
VATVVASGNVLFDHGGAPAGTLEQRIAQVVKDGFGIDSFAAVRSRGELASAIEDNPFTADGEPRFVHTVFLDRPLDRIAFDAFAAGYDGPERLACGEREYYVDYAQGVGRSKLDPAMARAKVIKGRATARNIRSLQRILETMSN